MNKLDERDPLAVFGVKATNAIVEVLEPLNPRDRRLALEDELNAIDVHLFPALNKRVGRMLINEQGLTELASIREALPVIFANHLKSALIKLNNGDPTALNCYACDEYESMGGFFGSVGSAFSSAANAVKNIACTIAPMATSVPNPAVAGGAAIAATMCGSGSTSGGMSQAEVFALLEQQRQAQQRQMLIYGGIGLGAILLVVALK